jgi:hypothetical protein
MMPNNDYLSRTFKSGCGYPNLEDHRPEVFRLLWLRSSNDMEGVVKMPCSLGVAEGPVS